ncbi:MAG: integrase, partial [Gammaproteobacteria bacterium]|nr:integrase [Gammaproteobacteria bacterium]
MDIQTRLRTMGQLRAFVEGNEAVDFQPESRDEAYGFVRDILERFGYRGLGRRDKGVVLRFLVAATGQSRQQMERLVRQWRETGSI